VNALAIAAAVRDVSIGTWSESAGFGRCSVSAGTILGLASQLEEAATKS